MNKKREAACSGPAVEIAGLPIRAGESSEKEGFVVVLNSFRRKSSGGLSLVGPPAPDLSLQDKSAVAIIRNRRSAGQGQKNECDVGWWQSVGIPCSAAMGIIRAVMTRSPHRPKVPPEGEREGESKFMESSGK